MSARQGRAKSLFLNAVELPTLAERGAYLDGECGGDEALRAEVEDLLRHFGQVGTFLESAAPGLGAAGPPAGEGPGAVIGPYKLLEQIGEGGFGMVFLAEQSQPVRRQVALKVLKPGMDSRQVVARFEAERQALALMDHPNIARVFDAGETESGRPYFVMELVRGTPITEFCDQNRLPVARRLGLFVEVCQAVQHAHQKGIIHRDLKPSNILVAPQDGGPLVKVIDFGIAKAVGLRLTDKTVFTGFAPIIGTPLYMSPEQAGFGGLDVDTRSDIYTLGVVLYELLTGTTPFDRQRLREADYDEIRRIVREEEPPTPSNRVSTQREAVTAVAARGQSDPKRLSHLLRGELDWIVMKALEKDRNRRYDTAGAFAADVQRYLRDEPVAAGPPSAWYRFRKFARRRRGALATAVVVTAALALAGGAAWWSERRQAAVAAEQKGREQALDDEVSRTADEAGSLIEGGKWPEALAAVERGEKLLAAAGRPGLPERLAELRNDLAMAQRLEEIYNLPEPGEPFAPGQDAAYARAFREYGIDVADLPPEEAAERIRARSTRLELARALDFWSRTRRFTEGRGATGWQSLLDLARAVDPDPWRNQLRDAVKQGDRKGLEELARSADVRRLPPQTLHLLGTTLVEAEATGQAETLLRAAQRQHPGDPWINGDLGWLCFRARPPQYGESLCYFAAALAARPSSPYLTCRVAWALLENGSAAEAFAVFSRALELAPDLPDAFTGRARSYLELGERDRALADLGKAIELDPRQAREWLNRALAYAKLRQWDESLADCSRAVELDPKLAAAWYTRAAAHANLGQWEGAAADYSRAIELTPGDAQAWTSRGCAYADLGQWDKALADHSRAIELDPKLALAWYNRGAARGQLGQWDGVLADCSRAVELDPKMAMAWSNRGSAYARQRKWDQAVSDYSRAVELDPLLVLTWYYRGFAFANLGRWDKAAADYARAVELAPKAKNYWALLGEARYRAADYKGAVAALERATELGGGGDAGEWLYLALAHGKLGNKEKARDWYDRAARRIEKNPAGYAALKALRAEAEELMAGRK